MDQDVAYARRAFRVLAKLVKNGAFVPSSVFTQEIYQLTDQRYIFSGGFSDVYHAISNSGQEVAVKRLKMNIRGNSMDADKVTQVSSRLTRELEEDPVTYMIRPLKCIYREALVWKQLKHPNILPFLGIDRWTFGYELTLVSPWMPQGTLLNYIKSILGKPDGPREQLRLVKLLAISYSRFVFSCRLPADGDGRRSPIPS
jgi:serine/threonine protein kinase